MGIATKIARRTFLLGSVAVSGGLAVGYWAVKEPFENPLLADLKDGESALTPYVKIDQSGITMIAPRAEMGQGVQSTLAALVAEELDVDWDDVKVEHGPESKAYINTGMWGEGVPIPSTDESAFAEAMRWGAGRVLGKLVTGFVTTGGSSAIVDGYDKMRKAGAAARLMLIAAASKKLGIPRGEFETDKGSVVAPDGTRISYSELAPLAAGINPPKDPPLKPKSEWKILGKSPPRLDAVAKSTGTETYGIDVQLPDMLYATVRMNPHRGATCNGFDKDKALAMPGVEKIIDLDNGIAVIATNTWYALEAIKEVECDWAPAAYGASSDDMYAEVSDTFDGTPDGVHSRTGDIDSLDDEEFDLSAEYRVPYQSHAAMEPMTAVALLKERRFDIWVGTQNPTLVKREAAEITGLSEEAIHVHTLAMGGAFGRRGETDFSKQATKIAVAMEGRPVKLTWSREEDMRHDFYRPLAMARMKGAVKEGRATSMDLKVAASSVFDSQFVGRWGVPLAGPDATLVQAIWDQPYGLENYQITAYKAPLNLPVGSWRSVGSSQNGFFHESAMDELAHAAGEDPLEMRLRLLTHEPSREVLRAAKEMSGWGRTLPEGHGLGVAFVLSFGVPTAEVFEVAMTNQGIKLVGIWAAADVGIALDPRNLEAQVTSGIIYALSAAIMGQITVENHRVAQSNFHDFEAMRMYQVPPMEIRILENQKHIHGIGEPGTPPAAPALANAVFAATGKRIRELPMNKHINFV